MPTYVYQCKGTCKRKYEAVHNIAERKDEFCCGKRSEQLIAGSVEAHTFTPHTFTDICETPIHVTSKRQLKELCKVHNVRAARLM